ncbi:DUF5719 family protein [Brachybacterium sp. AOP42-C2-15]|uniref:DUF5719 family protein n=1 Tax=Brachybacterium sp. AOP42-C2-15 TaxID=3457670 RepID=UPI004034120B
MAEHPTLDERALLDEHGEQPVPEHPRRSAARVLLSLAAVVPLALAAGALATAPWEDVPSVQRATVESEPGASTRWCQGPLLLPEELLDSGPDSELAVTPPSTAISLRTTSIEPGSSVLFGTVSGSTTQQEDDGSVRAPSITARGADGTDLGDQPVSQDIGVSVLDLPAAEGTPHVTSATSEDGRPVTDTLQSTITSSGDYRSLAVSRCAEPATEARFLGMSTDTGDSSVLVLHNPTERPATASVQLWTEEGPAAMEGRSQVVVAPGAEERVLLESIAAGQAAVGVDVSVLGSPLAMHVQTTERDGLTPGGAEILSPLPAASTELQMPGVDVAGTPPTLVLANPQGVDTTATVEVHGAEGALEIPALEEIEIPAGTVLRTTLDGLPDGTYAVSVRAADPIAAVTRSVRTGKDLPGDTVGAPVDFTLVAPAPALRSHGMSALPIQAGAGELTLIGTADSAVTVVPIAADGSAGDPVDVAVNTGSTTTVTAEQLQIGGGSAAALSVVPEVPGAVHASWMQRADDGAGGVLLSSVPVLSDQGGGEPVVVRLAE